ncbi:MAG: sterol desaturase family protein [Methylobacter sp.]|uniref:sterol desaturase family protein n=1 Tax=Methylobacter sp. TaxID=2051955 RepID=UPI002582A444|nr:sterol desaturase family protein [Methylobacter sp.]MCL7420136.1 sterol desaturase family protein [Methylobacter sp.]
MSHLNAFLESLITWAALTSGELATTALLVFFIILSTLEVSAPKEKLPSMGRRKSFQANINLFVFNSAALSLLPVSSLLLLAEQYSGNGLLSYIANPVWAAVLSFLLLDLMHYFWHKASHSFDCLWMFHKVHHSDPYLNVSTAFRVHFIELFIITALKAAYIILLGADKTTVLINETITTLFVMFHHSNITFRGEKLLGRLIIVPCLHRVHHSTERREHDRNYGFVLSIWDRLFGTCAELEPAGIGIKNNVPQDLLNLLKLGFTSDPAPAAPVPEHVKPMIAEAAYYKAKCRDFSPGHELYDWLEAERDILGVMYKDSLQRQPSRRQKLFNPKLILRSRYA